MTESTNVPSFNTFEEGVEFFERMGRDEIRSENIQTEEQASPYTVPDEATIADAADCFIAGKPYKFMGVKFVYAEVVVERDPDYESDDGC